MASVARSQGPSRTALLLTLLLVWAVGLRVWYGSKDLDIHRFWDEKYSVPNVHAALEQGSLQPTRYAYLRLTYLPQVAVLGLIQTGARLVDPEFSWFRGQVLSPSGFMVCRTVQALIGGLSIFLTFLVGRRLFSVEVGLLAAFLVAASPTHLILSAIFKPDILAVATTLIAFIFSLGAIDRPTLWRYLVAGLGIGLAVSSKPTAGAIAIPLVMAALILGFENRRHWVGLAAAGLTSVLLFLALNPYTRYLNAFDLQRRRYTAVARQKGTLGDPIATLHHELVTVFKGAHGPWIGAAAVAGLLLLGFQLWKHRHGDKTGIHLAMFLIYPVSFLLLYGLVTQNVLPQNLLPLLPFTSLAAAVFLMALWQQVARRWTWPADGRAAAAIGTLLVILVSIPAQTHAYRIVVPTTMERAISLLASELPRASQGWIRMESVGTSPEDLAREPGRTKRPPAHLLFWSSPRLTDIGQAALNRSDAEVFPLIRTEGPDGDFYRQRSSYDDRSHTTFVESRPFRNWGPDLVVALHPWQPQEVRTVELAETSGGGGFEYRFSASEKGPQVAAVEISLAGGRRGMRAPRVKIGKLRVEMKSVSSNRKRQIWTTDRFPLASDAEETLSIKLRQSPQIDTLEIVVRRWGKVL